MRLELAIAAAALAFSAQASAQDYPTRAVRIIIPLPAGSAADTAGRIVARRLSEHWKKPVIVENRPGAGGQAGTAAVAKADADGHTLLVQSSSYAANLAIYRSLAYDPEKDLADVAILGKTPYVMVTAADGPYKSLKALLEAAKARPGELAFASAGVRSSTHLAAEYVVGLAGLKMAHAPAKGSPAAMQEVLGGRAAFCMAPLDAAMPLVKEGKLRPLGVSTKARVEALPDVPTLAEQGLYSYDLTLWYGMWAPAQTPPQVVQKLNSAVNAIVLEPAVKAEFARLGIQPAPIKPEELSSFVRSEIDLYRKIVQHAGIARQ